MTGPVEPAPALGPVPSGAAYGLVIVLAVLLAVWGSFLVPLRVGATAVPLACVVAVVGNALLGLAGGRLLGRAGAAGPALAWLAVVLVLSSPRDEGDLVVPGTLTGLAFQALGTLTSAIVIGLPRTGRPRSG